MQATLSGAADPSLFMRAELFNKIRDNRGMFLTDKDTEKFFQYATSLSGVDALQAQAQEQMASVSSIPWLSCLASRQTASTLHLMVKYASSTTQSTPCRRICSEAR
jgi:hypothetical protein